MKIKKTILPLLALTLFACGENASTSNSISNSQSTMVPPSIDTSIKPSILPSVSSSASIVQSKNIRMNVDDVKDSLPSTSSNEEAQVTFEGLRLGLVSCNYGTYSGKGYLMMRKTSDTNGAGHIYNLNDLENITSVVVKFSASTSQNVILGASFGNNPLTSPITETTIKEQAEADKVVTFTNPESGCGYFNLSVMNNYNCQIVELLINIDGATGTIS